MNLWNQYRLIDIFSNVDLSLVETDVPEKDLENEQLCPQDKKSRWNGRRIAVVSGIAAAGSLALTGVVVLVCRRHDAFRRAA